MKKPMHPVFETLADHFLMAHTAKTLPAKPYLEADAARCPERAAALGMIPKLIQRAYAIRDMGLLFYALDCHLRFARLAVTCGVLEMLEAGDFPPDDLDCEFWTGVSLKAKAE